MRKPLIIILALAIVGALARGQTAQATDKPILAVGEAYWNGYIKLATVMQNEGLDVVDRSTSLDTYDPSRHEIIVVDLVAGSPITPATAEKIKAELHSGELGLVLIEYVTTMLPRAMGIDVTARSHEINWATIADPSHPVVSLPNTIPSTIWWWAGGDHTNFVVQEDDRAHDVRTVMVDEFGEATVVTFRYGLGRVVLIGSDPYLWAVNQNPDWNDLLANAVAWVAPELIPFARFELVTCKLDFASAESADHYRLIGELELGAASDGVDILNEPVGVETGPSSIRIPAGEFERDGTLYTWQGTVNGAEVEAAFEDRGEGTFVFAFDVRAVDLTGATHPEMRLVVGNEAGEARHRLEGQLRLPR